MRNSSKVGQLAKSDGHATKLSDKVAQVCCVSDIGLRRQEPDGKNYDIVVGYTTCTVILKDARTDNGTIIRCKWTVVRCPG